ncbi:unnamed protein product [Adineta steineri]|uniref:Uncharacterized protein n=1 Tax=Adineta steineri TaxID=433720 RepID=A0A813U066_9BILA|nr:unnamed protein product [Adineta steineri]CAF3576724.1 unnamed protein product [Adineta steineri]
MFDLDMALSEQAPSSRSSSRLAKLSSNMFFTRHVAHPQRCKHIEGLNGAMICAVNDDPSLIRSASSALSFNMSNLPTLPSSRRVERLVPNTGFWSTHGIVNDTENWKRELASLANASGLGLEKEDRKQNKPATADPHASRSGAHYSTRTGRFNEGTAKSRGRTGSKHSTAYSDTLFNVPESEREMWMLQVLCQLLGTSDLEDVQSWLISASHTEKDQARTMINSALRGLKESDRSSDQSQQPVDLDSLSEFVEKQKVEGKQASQKFIKESLNRPVHSLQPINEESNNDTNSSPDPLLNAALKKQSTLPLVNTTTYQISFPNYNQSPASSLEAITSSNRNNIHNENEQNQYNHDDNEEQIETIRLDDDVQRTRSPPVSNTKKQTPLQRSSSNHKQRRFDSFQLNDNNNNTENKRKETGISSNKTIESSNEDDDVKARRIRDLQNKLSQQEEDSKKQIDELQTRQSRLENALKLIVKQTAYGKRRKENNTGSDKNPDGSLANIDSQKENDHFEINSQNSSNFTKSRDENRSNKSFGGVWKPDASVLQRMQGN